MKKMRIYIIVADFLDDRHNVGIFTSRKRAEKALEEITTTNKLYKQFKEDLYIEAYEVNAFCWW